MSRYDGNCYSRSRGRFSQTKRQDASLIGQEFDEKDWDWVVDCTGYKQSAMPRKVRLASFGAARNVAVGSDHPWPLLRTYNIIIISGVVAPFIHLRASR